MNSKGVHLKEENVMKNITIRMFMNADIIALLPLMAELGYPATLCKLQKRLAEFMSMEGYRVAVACDNHQVLGFVA